MDRRTRNEGRAQAKWLQSLSDRCLEKVMGGESWDLEIAMTIVCAGGNNESSDSDNRGVVVVVATLIERHQHRWCLEGWLAAMLEVKQLKPIEAGGSAEPTYTDLLDV